MDVQGGGPSKFSKTPSPTMNKKELPVQKSSFAGNTLVTPSGTGDSKISRSVGRKGTKRGSLPSGVSRSPSKGKTTIIRQRSPSKGKTVTITTKSTQGKP